MFENPSLQLLYSRRELVKDWVLIFSYFFLLGDFQDFLLILTMYMLRKDLERRFFHPIFNLFIKKEGSLSSIFNHQSGKGFPLNQNFRSKRFSWDSVLKLLGSFAQTVTNQPAINHQQVKPKKHPTPLLPKV